MRAPHRLVAAAILVAATFITPAQSAIAADYPNKAIDLIVPVVPGGSADALGRLIADELSTAFKQSVIVENKPGAGMVIGLTAAAQAAPDGYTLVIGPRGPIIIGPTVPSGLPFEPNEKLVAVAKIASVPIVIVANADSGIKSIDDLIKRSKSTPGGISFASPGQYTSHRIAVEILAHAAGIELTHVPYRGGGQALTDLLGKQFPVAALDLVSVQQYIDSGRLVALGVTGSRRALEAPNIPTLREQGYDVPPVDSWLGVLAPKGTPNDVIEKLSDQLGKSFQLPRVQERLKSIGLDLDFEPASKFGETMSKDFAGWVKLKDEVMPRLTKE